MSIIDGIRSKIIIWLFGTKRRYKDINLKNVIDKSKGFYW